MVVLLADRGLITAPRLAPDPRRSELGVMDSGFEVVDGHGREGDDFHGPAGAEIDGQERGGGVVGGLDHRHEVILTEQRELDDDLAPDGFDLLVDRVESSRTVVQGLAPFGSERAQQDVHRHGRPPRGTQVTWSRA